MRNSTRTRKAEEERARASAHADANGLCRGCDKPSGDYYYCPDCQSETGVFQRRPKPVAPLATAPQHLRACREASRSRSLLLSDIPVAWQGQPLKSAKRQATGETYTVGEGATQSLRTFIIERSEVTERTQDFNRVVHLRGISGTTYNLMIGTTKPDNSATPSERAYGCVTHSPNDGERYKEKMLIRTRKGHKLVQRPNKQRTIELESAYQVKQAGPLFTDRAGMMTAEGLIESERITIDAPDHSEPRIAVSRVIESMTDSGLAALYSASERDCAAITRGYSLADHPHAGRPLDVPQREDAAIPSGRNGSHLVGR